MRLSVDECSEAITLIGIIYQYLCIKIIRFSGSRQKRKSLRACLSVLLSEISSVTPTIHIPASSPLNGGCLSRTSFICCFLKESLLSERLRVILPRNADSFLLRRNGIPRLHQRIVYALLAVLIHGKYVVGDRVTVSAVFAVGFGYCFFISCKE